MNNEYILIENFFNNGIKVFLFESIVWNDLSHYKILFNCEWTANDSFYPTSSYFNRNKVFVSNASLAQNNI